MMINQKDRLSRLLFLEFNQEKAKELFNSTSLGEAGAELYVPINPDYLIGKINNNEVPKDLPVSEFIAGMAYALALDPDFKFAPEYLKMLKGYPHSETILKKKIADLFKSNQKICVSFWISYCCINRKNFIAFSSSRSSHKYLLVIFN